MDTPEDQKSVADLVAEKQVLMTPQHCHCGRELPCFDHPWQCASHRPGCRMPGCEGECWTGTGYSPAEVRAMAEDRVPIRSADDFLNKEYTYVEPRFASAFREGWRARSEQPAPPLDVERLARAMEICGIGFYHATEPRMLLEQSFSAIAAEYERLGSAPSREQSR